MMADAVLHQPGASQETSHDRSTNPTTVVTPSRTGPIMQGTMKESDTTPSTSTHLPALQTQGIRESDQGATNALEEHQEETNTPVNPRNVVRFDAPESNGDNTLGSENASPRERQASFLGKLKFLASSPTSNHARRPSSGGTASPTVAMTPASERSEPTYPVEPVETDGDADEDSDGGDVPADLRPKKRRKSKRPALRGTESAPSTPRMQRLESRFASFLRDTNQTQNRENDSPSRPRLHRRGTTSDAEDDARLGISEDEGRDRIRAAWRRGIESARGLSYSARKQNDADAGSPDDTPKRPSHFRRLTGLGGGTDGATPFRMKADRQASSSAQKWRQVKAGLKMLGQRKRDERMRVDHQKSAQLMAELLAGAPAVLVFASMFQRDEHGHKKLPVLLEQLKISIPDSKIREDKKGDRHLVFRIDLEYGNGPARMQWTIQRTLKDFVNLHLRYQSMATADKVRHLRSENKSKAKMPKFPKTAFPYARTLRGLFENLQEEDDEEEAVENRLEQGTPGIPPTTTNMPPRTGSTQSHLGLDDSYVAPANPTDGPPQGMHKRRKSSYAPTRLRRTSTSEFGPPPADPDDLTARQKEMYAARQRRKLETYLQAMITWLIFRADSTRLCKFLELSTIAIRLSAEGGYQGKQGLLTIASRRNRELGRNPMKTQTFIDRHKPRWFLVRHSYVLCVDSPDSLNIYDVFLVDSDFSTVKRKKRIAEQKSAGDVAKTVAENSHPKHLILRLYNAERKLKLIAPNERLLVQFQESINLMVQSTIWSKKQRFASYAPVRDNVWCRWLVDGRDHMWQVSRAIDMAKDLVYIHDWWLSPELYMRRPAAISQEWRLDRLLLRKARQGVKIFVIVYRNIESAIPIDSEYTKWSLLDLDPNILVQRSPNQFRQNQFFWAHHEKLVVVDNMMAFVGGVDLCFGRWDDPCHTLTDDKLTGFEPNFSGRKDADSCQVWPGKDYSNPRVQDFYGLDRPYEEMYDRTKVPRMPWHDISMQIIGQPARDVARHFVQRWNYILRNRIPSRPTPVLLPPPEYEQEELEKFGMTGTCRVQVLRSCSSWSIGTPNKVEHSIMNAYVHLIENSEHFVYIENQFYISSCTVEGSTIHNTIGDALVERAIRAHENGDNWQACLVIPLMPGFQNSVDSQDGTSIRLIMQCQYRSICRGETSIFGRLRAHNIEPEDYIRFYSLRQWGKIGPRKCLTTEQLYIHAKCMVVDDRHVIIGSANINERSLLGSRDSEVACIVTDTKMIPGKMGGVPYEVGEFPHTLRRRLMREHLGVDVDAIYRRDELMREREMQDREMERIYGEAPHLAPAFPSPSSTPLSALAVDKTSFEANSSGHTSNMLAGTTRVGSSLSLDRSDRANGNHHDQTHEKHKRNSADLQHDLDVAGFGHDNMKAFVDAGEYGFTDSYIDSQGREVLVKKDAPGIQRIKSMEEELESQRTSRRDRDESISVRPPWPTERMDTYTLGLPTRSRLPELPALDDTDIGGPPLPQHASSISAKIVNPLVQSMRRPEVHEDCMLDPIVPKFYQDIWHQVAENNTKLYRAVFRCMPDSEVQDWKTYERFNEYNERFMQSQGLGSSKPRPAKDAPGKSGPPGSGGTDLSSIITEDNSADARPRSKSVISEVVGKLRPRGKTVDERTPLEDTNEKDNAAYSGEHSPGSRGSHDDPNGGSSPSAKPMDEKEAHRLADEQQQQQAVATSEITKEKEEDNDDEPANEHLPRIPTVQYAEKINKAPETTATQSVPTAHHPSIGIGGLHPSASQKRRRRATTKSSAKPPPEEILGRDDAEDLLKLVQGHLVLWPYDWLEKEERGGNWLYNIDQLAPLEIYD